MSLLCPLSSRPAKSSPPAPWLTETLCCHRRELRNAERWWRKSHVDSDLSSYKSLLSEFSLEITSAKLSNYSEKFKSSASDPRKLFAIFSSLLNPPPPSPSSSLTPEDFITFFEEKVSSRISACLNDIVSWMTAHNFKINPSKTELLFIPETGRYTSRNRMGKTRSRDRNQTRYRSRQARNTNRTLGHYEEQAPEQQQTQKLGQQDKTEQDKNQEQTQEPKEQE
ncbi:hypothetical protein P4O66_000189 [Electrophorus voltai]|uniref:Reverse transcriptase domain-containing protein n=1 Tax=Electrophorus voltai TaxID=2609070 RepID=A0AAD8ZIL8_9TELE|nr:hypothetical protein P4O66_000189 [Electrophorus voltai]